MIDDAPDLPPSEAIRQRLHKVAEMAFAHEGKLSEHALRLDLLDRKIEQSASKDQLEAAEASVTARVDAHHTEVGIRLDNLQKQLNPIQTGIYWLIGLVLSGVVMAVMNLILRKP